MRFGFERWKAAAKSVSFAVATLLPHPRPLPLGEGESPLVSSRNLRLDLPEGYPKSLENSPAFVFA